jgi:Kef-type K+ transport system membrane component KefB
VRLSAQEDILILDWIGDMALGFIGLLAGGHLRVTEMASSLSTALVLVAVTALVTYLGMLAVILSFGGLFIPLFGVLSQPQELAIAMLVASLSVARSADALIAIITELNAKGPFTTIILAVTIMIDIIVVVVFAITLEVARVIDQHAMAANVLEVVSDTIFGGRRLEGEIGDMILDDAIGRRRLGSTDEAPMTAPSSADGLAPHGHLVQTILFDFSSKMLVSLVLGYLLAHLLTHLLTRKAQPATWPAQGAMDGGLGCTALGMALGLLLRAPLAALQTASLPTSGWLLFYGQEVSEEEGWAWSFDPLFTAIVAGFIIVNYTRGGQAFDETCHVISRPIFLLFFVFIGVSMKLNLLVHNLSACLFIFFSRLALIIIGTRLGGHLAGSPVEHSNMYWMGLFTQAGVTIGLAHHAAFYFAWGPDFAAMIIGAAVLNQIFGPPLTKYAIRVAGEDSAAVLSPSAAVGAPSAEARVTEML